MDCQFQEIKFISFNGHFSFTVTVSICSKTIWAIPTTTIQTQQSLAQHSSQHLQLNLIKRCYCYTNFSITQTKVHSEPSRIINRMIEMETILNTDCTVVFAALNY